jgi:hypothetical protein
MRIIFKFSTRFKTWVIGFDWVIGFWPDHSESTPTFIKSNDVVFVKINK